MGGSSRPPEPLAIGCLTGVGRRHCCAANLQTHSRQAQHRERPGDGCRLKTFTTSGCIDGAAVVTGRRANPIRSGSQKLHHLPPRPGLARRRTDPRAEHDCNQGAPAVRASSNGSAGVQVPLVLQVFGPDLPNRATGRKPSLSRASCVGHVRRFWHGFQRAAAGCNWLPVSRFRRAIWPGQQGCPGRAPEQVEAPAATRPPGLNWQATRTLSATPQTQPAKPTAVPAAERAGLRQISQVVTLRQQQLAPG